MANSYSLEKSSLRKESRTIVRARGRIAVSILVSARDGISESKLGLRAAADDELVSLYVDSLRESGLIQRVKGSEDYYETTGNGLKFVMLYQDLWRLNSQRDVEKKQVQSGYYGCKNCAPHPGYPDTLPVTLHGDGICRICNTRA